MRKAISILSLLFLIIFASGLNPLGSSGRGGAVRPEVRLSFDHFYDHAELTDALKQLQKAYPDLMKLQSIGKSYRGRDIWAVIITNPATGPAERKPGFYIDGNIHGNEIQGTEVALYTIYYLLKNFGKLEFVDRLLNTRAFYIVPTMNPDARDYFLHMPADSNMPRSGLVPYDDDRDGLYDEDGPDDLDGDGSITFMRRRDPDGNLKTSPDNPLVMVPCRPGEKGEFILLGLEGIDNDGDGQINEDGPGGYDMNRNFGFNWQPNYVQRGAGYYPFCWPETKAVRDFLLAHPNIMGAQSFHNYGGMILRGPGAKNLGEIVPQDRQIYDYIGKQGEKILPGYRYIVIYKDMYTVYGGTVDFTYYLLGIYTFSNELDFDQYAGTQPASQRRGGEEDEESARGRMFRAGASLEEILYHQLVLMGEQLVEWKPYKHPLYGEIEIGGIKKTGRRVPALFRLAETCHRNAAFCLYHADQLPLLKVDRVNVKKLESGLYQVDVRIANDRVTPSISAQAVQRKLHRPDQLKIRGKARLVSAGIITDRFRELTDPVKVRENYLQVENGIPGFGQVDFRLLVEGSGEINLIYDSLKGGYIEQKISLK
ncbi:MAG: M14 family metallopeptidase [Candidatus Saccharicenans sp.]|nr:M14 family metallopeptidase [Candidatus Saccharicenans sp.]